MNTLTITFNNQQFDIRTNTEGLYSLTDIEQAWKQSGGKGKRLDHWKVSPEVEELKVLFPEIRVSNVKTRGINAGTWASKEALIEYAGHCSTTFKITTLRALKQLSEGNYLEASDTMLSQVQTAEFKTKYKEAQDKLFNAFSKWNIKQGHERSFDVILKNLVQFNTCGITSKKIRNESNITLLNSLLSQGNTAGITAMLASMNLLCVLMDINASYYEMKKAVAYHLFTNEDAVKLKKDIKARDKYQLTLIDKNLIEAEAMLSDF
jgi:hypothetical protein